MRHVIRWENQKGRRAGLRAGQAGSWYQCLLLFAGSVLSLCSAYMQLMDIYPQLHSLALPGAYAWYLLSAAAALALIYGSGKLKYWWLRLLLALPLGWCFYRYYKNHQIPLEDGGLYLARCYVEEMRRFFKTGFFFPGGLREEAPEAFLFWGLLLLCGLFILAAVFRMPPLMLLLPAGLLAAHIAVGKSPGWDSIFALLAAGVVLVVQWKAAPERWQVRTLQLVGMLCICGITSLACASIPRRVVGMHEDIQKKQLALEDAALALPVWGLFEQHGRVDNHSPGATGREVLSVWLSDAPTENIYLKNYAASHYADGQWSGDADASAFASAAKEQGLTPAAAGGQLLSGTYEAATEICGNEEAIDFLNSGGWSMAKPGEHDYRVTCKDFGTSAPLPYVGTLPERLSMNGDMAAKRPWNLKSYGGSLMMGSRESDPLAEYLEMYYTAKNWMEYADSYVDLLGSSQFFEYPGNDAEPTNAKEHDWYGAMAKNSYRAQSDAPFIRDFMVSQLYSGHWNETRLYQDTLWEDGQTGALNCLRLVEARDVQQGMQSFGVYSQNLDPLPEGVDPIDYFLSTSGRGYCVHYASAATLMLQTLGVPARYASGYVVFPRDFDKVQDKDGYTAHVTDERAHAWVEIYLEGFGWLPIEVTPGFAGSGEQETTQEDGNKAAETDGQGAENGEQQEEQEEPQEETDEPAETNGQEAPAENPKGTAGGLSRELRLVLCSLAGLALAALLVCALIHIARQRDKRIEEQIRKSLEAGRHNEAGNRMNRRIYKLLRRRTAGLAIKDDESYRKALQKLEADGNADAYIRLVKQAYFSDEEMSTADARALYEMYRVYRDVLRHRKSNR